MDSWKLNNGVLVRCDYNDDGRIVLALDFDGVLTYPNDLKAIILNEKGYQIQPDECIKQQAIPLMADQTNHQEAIKDYRAMIAELYIGRMMDVAPKQGMQDVMRSIDRDMFSPVIVTSRTDEQLSAARRWISKYDVGIDAMFNTSEKPKTDILRELRPRAFVDDSLNKIVPIVEAMPDELKSCDLVYFSSGLPSDVESIQDAYSWHDIKLLFDNYAMQR